MQYKRHESFRYTFQEPELATYKLIIEKEGAMVETKQSDALVLNLSPNGARIKTTLDLPIQERKYLLELQLNLNGTTFSVLGIPVWKRREINQYVYGIEALEDQKTKQIVINELKQFVNSRKKL
ncbi:PilZ domain-containing protein [Rossellomorea aquimaris]|uniref:PilZ domain-containing protein n=1 Tax=Rossellomorea aquimaris TaxID=189382 RepID=UPI001CD35885|nr:PilZ domain-containing protein [Rossellomorea aquimaris]MCA1056638.1 PilZ domain-containing protein [Rossellomorea aquimaris]